MELTHEAGTYEEAVLKPLSRFASLISTSGRVRADDGGQAVYHRVESEPRHPGKLRDGSGAWYEQLGAEFRPEQFGGFAQSKDATSAVQKAIDTAAATGGWVRLSAGLWNVADVVHRSNVTVRGDGPGTTIVRRRSGPSVIHGVWTTAINGATSHIRLESLTLDGTSAADKKSVLTLADIRKGISLLNVHVVNGMDRWAVTGWSSRTYHDFRGLLHFHNCPFGALMLFGNNPGNTNIDVSGSTFRKCGHNILSIRCHLPDSQKAFDCNIGVNLDNTIIEDCLQTGPAGPIPVETWGCTNFSHRNFVIDTGTRGATAGAGMRNGIIGPGRISRQTIYAIEAGASRNVLVTGVEAVDCASFAVFTTQNVHDWTCKDCSLKGTGRTKYEPSTGPDIVKTVPGLFVNVRFMGFNVSRPEFVRHVMNFVLDPGSSIYLDNIVITSDTPNSTLGGIAIGGAGGETVLRRPRITRTAAIAASHFQAKIGLGQITLPVFSKPGLGSVTIIKPTCEQLGRSSPGVSLFAIGRSGPQQAMYGIRIEGGEVRGAYSMAIALPTSGKDTEINGLDIRRVVRIAAR